jgi:predicted thioredoxin/glutaredoxin
MALGLAYLTRPFVMIDASHKHDFDQFLFFISGDPNNFVEFDAEVELTLDGKVNSITYASWVYIPKGLMHCPLNVKRVGKPIIFMDGRLTKEASVGPGFKGSK